MRDERGDPEQRADRFVVWCRTVGVASAAGERPMLDVLARSGVLARPLAGDEPRGPGVVFFGEVTSELCQFLRAARGNGCERVLAIALAPAAGDEGECWSVLRAGASDVFAWCHSTDPGAAAAARFARWAAIDRLVDSPLVQSNLVGRSAQWRSTLRQVVEVANFTDAPVLLTGESGTGKELVARLVHSLDRRPRKRELVVLDCTTVVRELSGSEFFGHERGAFTGALGARDGAFALANGGTLFLDEVGELPLELQAQLLRVAQERTYKRVGGNAWQRTEFRLVCATNRALQDDVADGRFRADLYYRIAGAVCHLPALRDRREDVVPLFRHFFEQLRPGADAPALDEQVRLYLLRRAYPGNVRDLRQLASRIAYRHVGPGPITVGDIPEDERPAADAPLAGDWQDASFDGSIRRAMSQGAGLKDIGRLAAETAIRIAVSEEEGNLQRAAQKLGVTDRALQMRKATKRQEGPAPGLRQTT